YISLALDDLDYPHSAYFIGRPGNLTPPSTLRYAFWNGTGWEITMVDQSYRTQFAGETCSLALDENGHAHICYLGDEASSYCLKYAHWTGTSWDIQVVDNESGWVGEFCSLKLDSLGCPHISYYDKYYDCLKYASWDGQEWDVEVVNYGFGWCTSLQLDSFDYPCIAYYGEGHNLDYVRWNGTGWDFHNVDNFGGNVGSIDVSLALDSQCYPHITYYMFNNTLRYARWDGSDWIITTVTGNYGGAYSWLVLDSQDYPHIVYYQAVGNNWNVWYKYWDGSYWHNEVVNEPLGGGWNCRIALDSHEYPRICYYDQNDVSLDYASPRIEARIEDEITPSSVNTSIHLDNYPNPFNPTTTVSFVLEENAKASIEVFNVRGQLVRTLLKGKLDAGLYRTVWNGRDEHGMQVRSGTYFYRLNIGGLMVDSRKCLLLK
ncbi:MAG: T9SS type A sorting domain-containing protein, partial [Candidatus Eisenbacteria sp.]|nr:T9SS type A sorting domain-containing protein [Candidatus Eisenbacteria bacterium]